MKNVNFVIILSKYEQVVIALYIHSNEKLH